MIDNYEANKLNEALESIANSTENDRVGMVGQVLGTDENGVTWVHVLGGTERTPLASTTTQLSKGDIVDVTIGGGKAVVRGNLSDPAAGASYVGKVEKIANDALGYIEYTERLAENAERNAEASARIAAEAAEVANATGQHFWYDDNGAHVTDATQEDWAKEYAKTNHGELEDPTENKPWYNQLIGSMGTLIRSGLKNLVSLTRSAIAFYDGKGNSESNIVARFGADGSQIGYSSGNHLTMTADGLGVFSGNSYSNVNGVDIAQTASDASTAKSDAATAKSDASTAKSTASTAKSTADTAKSTADTAKSTADTAKSTADAAKTAASSATTTANNASKAADEAKEVANKTKENFWADTSGVHVSTNASKADGAFNSLFTSTGLLFRKAANNLLSLTGSALNFYDGSGNAAANVLASFGSTVQLGKTAEYHYYGTSNSFGLYPGGNNTAANALFYVNNTPSVRIGKQAANAANLYMTATGLQLRSNTTAQARFLTDQSVSAWPNEYGSATAVFSGLARIDGGSDTGKLVIAGDISLGNGSVIAYSSGLLRTTNIRCFNQLRLRRDYSNGNTGAVVALMTEYYGDKNATSDGIETVSPNSSWNNAILYTACNGYADGHAVLLGGGGLTIIGGGEFATSFYNLKTFAANSETLHLGSDGATYIYTNGNTIANRKTYTFSTAGNLTLPQKQSSMVYTGSTLTDTTPSSNQYPGGLYVLDNTESQFAYVRGLHQTNGNRGLQIEARRSVSGSYKYNTLNLTLDTSGNAVVGLGGTNVAAAWRTAIGANNASNLTTGTVPRARIENTAWAYLVGSASATNYVRWRMVAGWVTVEVYYASGAGLSTTSKKFATVPANYRPSKYVTIACLATGNNVAWLGVDTDGSVKGAVRSGTAAAVYGSIIYPLG